MDDVNALESNLHEMCASGGLVPDLSGKCIYSSKSGWGILYCWIFAIADFLGMEDLKKNCFERAMTHTHQIFSDGLQKTIETSKAFEESIVKKSAGEEVDKNTLSKQRHTISRWHTATQSFKKIARSNEHINLKNIIGKRFVDFHSSDYKSPFSESIHSEEIKKMQKIVYLEGQLQLSLPLKILFKASKKMPFIKSEKREFKHFIKKINEIDSFIKIRDFHRTLKAIVEVFNANSMQNVVPETTRLEMILANYGCRIIIQKDPKYIAQRDALKPGDTIVCNRRELTLGAPLGDREKKEDHNIVFATDDPNVVLSIGDNCTLHPLKRMLVDEESWGIESAKYIDIDEKSGYALIEKLHDHLGSYVWISQSNQIQSADEDIAIAIGKLLKWFLDQGRTPINFSPNYLMFDNQGYLKCLKATSKGGLDFNALVEFAYRCSASNKYIYRYLMVNSELNTHLFAKFYEEMAAYAARSEYHDAADVAASMGIHDSRIVDRGRKLVDEIGELRKRVESKIMLADPTADPVAVRKRVGEQFFQNYKDSATAGLLPDFLEAVMISTL